MEALDTVPLLARAIEQAGISAPITSALARLIEGSLPLDEWVYGVDSRAEYVRRQSPRLKALEVGTSLSEPVNYGSA